MRCSETIPTGLSTSSVRTSTSLTRRTWRRLAPPRTAGSERARGARMLHNSILIRDRLRAANQNPLCRARRDLHRQLAVTDAAVERDGELALTGAWAVAMTGTLPGLAEAGDDLR